MAEAGGRLVLCCVVGCGERVGVGGLRGHLADHIRYYPFKCAHCDSVFTTEEKLRLHAQLCTHHPLKIVEDPILEKERKLEQLMASCLQADNPPASSPILPSSPVETGSSTGGRAQKRVWSGAVEMQLKLKKAEGESSGLEAPKQKPEVTKCGLCSRSFMESQAVLLGLHIRSHTRDQMKAEGGGSYERVFDQVGKRCFPYYVPRFGWEAMDCAECGKSVVRKASHVLHHHIHKPAFRCPHCHFRQFRWSMLTSSAFGQEHMKRVHGEPGTMMIDDRAGLKAELEAWLRRCFESSKPVGRPRSS